MALFRTKKKEKKEVKKKEVKLSSGLEYVIKNPRITEKAAYSAEKNAYVFNVDPKANKEQIALAIKKIYKVEPVKVNISKIPSKKKFIRGNWGLKKGGKKAYVYLKKGDKIEII